MSESSISAHEPENQVPDPSAAMSEWARFYTGSCRWALVPIPRGQKGPRRDGWNLPRSSDNPLGFVTDPDLAVSEWKRPRNMGVVLAPSRLVSIDIDEMEVARRVLGSVGISLDGLLNAGCRLEGNPERAKVFFQAPQGADLSARQLKCPAKVKGEKADTIFELRAGAIQDVLPPSIHPDTGQPYKWVTPPWKRGIPSLPLDVLQLWQSWPALLPQMKAAMSGAKSTPTIPPNLEEAANQFRIDGDDVRDRVRQSLCLDALLEQLGAIRAGGRSWHCPFHQPDQDPSFWTYTTPNGTELWVDGHSDAPVGRPGPSGYFVGDAIDLYQHVHSIGFAEAIRRLADEHGMPVPRWSTIGSAGPVRSDTNNPTSLSDIDLDRACSAFQCTDNDNGQRFVLRYADRVRFNHSLGWLAWDGRQWTVDNPHGAAEFAKVTATRIYAEGPYLEEQGAPLKRAKWAAISSMGRGRREILAAAESDPRVSVDLADIDKDPWLLNVGNGTLNLRTGNLRPHSPLDCISKLAGTDYDLDARCPAVDEYMKRIMAGNEDLITYIWRAIGYSLTAHTGERALFFLHGDGANGKSTLINLIRALLREYAMQTPAETLLAKRTGAIPNDLARLRGARFVATVEVEDGRHLAEAIVKQITGGDAIAARFMHKEWFEYVPTFKVWLAANHKPVIRGTDSAIWERIRLIPFNVTIPKADRDRDLLGKLIAELPGVLRRAVEGCLEWQAKGLQEPIEVSAATAEYRTESDHFQNFLEERCLLKAGTEVPAADLRANYEAWCSENGEKTSSQKSVAARLKALGCESQRGTGGNFRWHGIGLVK